MTENRIEVLKDIIFMMLGLAVVTIGGFSTNELPRFRRRELAPY